MKKKIKKIFTYINRIPKLINVFINVIKFGGYTTVNISEIQHGEILQDKKILITGGSSGIGLSIAKKCIKEGAKVLITGRNESKLEDAKRLINNQFLKTLCWDVSNISEIDTNLKKTEELLGGEIDILVNNAGLVNGANFYNVTDEIWDKIYSTNSKGLFFLSQALCKKWRKRKVSNLRKIINISSQGGFVGATYPYGMTKWDIAGLTQGLGLKFAPEGIIVNGIAPGIIATEMQPGCVSQKENVFSSRNPLARFALPEEIAELALFLMSNAGNFIVGQTILCDGGYTLK